ncbi:hypothetical protein Hte_001884 [Hypoxylon texense]
MVTSQKMPVYTDPNAGPSQNEHVQSVASQLQKAEGPTAVARNSSLSNTERADLDRPDELDDGTARLRLPLKNPLKRSNLKIDIPALPAPIQSTAFQKKGSAPLPKSRHFLQAKEQTKGDLGLEQGRSKPENS